MNQREKIIRRGDFYGGNGVGLAVRVGAVVGVSVAGVVGVGVAGTSVGVTLGSVVAV